MTLPPPWKAEEPLFDGEALVYRLETDDLEATIIRREDHPGASLLLVTHRPTGQRAQRCDDVGALAAMTPAEMLDLVRARVRADAVALGVLRG